MFPIIGTRGRVGESCEQATWRWWPETSYRVSRVGPDKRSKARVLSRDIGKGVVTTKCQLGLRKAT